MSTSLVLELRDTARTVATGTRYHRLVLLVGEPRTGKTTALRELSKETGWPLLSLNLALSERLLEAPTRFRQIQVADLVRDLADASTGEALVIDNIELLFDRQLEVDPVGLLLSLARHRLIVASWPGSYDGSTLSYADPTHPEYRRDPRPDCAIVQSCLSTAPAGAHQPRVES